MPNTHHTSLIKLKPEYAERYIVLHKHTFPGVLERIARSNIHNYSIFLHEDMLFSHFEYKGEDYDKDMALMADETTKEWWSLTDPMQEPLTDRKEGEWWAGTEQLALWENPVSCECKCRRQAFTYSINAGIEDIRKAIGKDIMQAAGCTPADFQKILLSYHGNALYLYAESCLDKPSAISRLQEYISGCIASNETTGFIPMKEVFFTNKKNTASPKKVFVTGCFDLLHSGHMAFISEAAGYGDLYVCIGSDENVQDLKGRYPVNNQDERAYTLNALQAVKECRINTGFGILDFLDEIELIKPDIFVVNEDGNTPSKAELCRQRGIEYKVLKRIPHSGLPRRSTTDLRQECNIPYRIDIAGGWLDQPWVSEHYPGSVITISVEPTIEFNHRSGMASSTRRKAIELWKTDIPVGDREQLAKMLFSFENPPGTEQVSGSQDSLGIVLPGLNKLDYDHNYWPSSIHTHMEEDTLNWLENTLYLIPLGPRRSGFDVLKNTKINKDGARALALAAEGCWSAIREKNINDFGHFFRASFEAQISMFPNMVDEEIMQSIDTYRNKVKGWKLSGAGGGGYLIFVSEHDLEGAVKIRIRKENNL